MIHLKRYKAREKFLHAFNGEELQPYERRWLGSAYDVGSIHSISSRPEWLVMPIRDVGIQVRGVGDMGGVGCVDAG